MKYTRLIIGIAAILATLWVIIGEQMTAASADAVVNAPVITLRAPIAGDLELQSHVLGARLAANEIVAAVSDPRADNVRLNDLQLERDVLDAENARLQRDLAARSREKDAFAERTAQLTQARVASVEAQLAEARTRLDLLKGAGQERISGVRTDAELADPNDPIVRSVSHAIALSQARERVATLEISLDALKNGVVLGEGYSDASFSEQRRLQLDSEIARLDSERSQVAARRAALERRITQSRQYIGRNTRAELRAPSANMLYWETLQADGVSVQRGDPLLRIVDCGQSLVTLSVTESVFNTLRVGQDASFRFSGASKVYPASVGRLAGSGARTVYANLAVAPSEKHLERFDVTLVVPALNADRDLGCAIGRTGRAFFDGRPLDLFRGWFN